MKLIQKSTFKKMPWKNGGGVTTELYCHTTSQSHSFLLRFSIADVSTHGPFSNFPGIDRYLVILEGNGCKLQREDQSIELKKESLPYFFPGEVKIHCSLIDGSVKDFNVMIDRLWGKASVRKYQAAETILNSEDMAFYFCLETEEFIELEKNESLNLGHKAWIGTHITLLKK